jgi:hypothetical protein
MAESGAPPKIPRSQSDDNEDISWALSTAEAMWSRGDLIDAIKWVRRAAEAASDAEQDQRALDLAKAAADLQNQVGGASAQPPSQPPPPPPFAPLMAAAHTAVTAAPPNGTSTPPGAERSPPPPAAAASTDSSRPPRVSPSAPPPAVGVSGAGGAGGGGGSFAAGARGPLSAAVTKRPSVIPRPSGTPAAPAVARVSHPRPLAPRASGAPPLPPAPPPSGSAPFPMVGQVSVSQVPPVQPVPAQPSAMPPTARAIEAASPAAPESVPPPEASSQPSSPPPAMTTRRPAFDGTDPTATSHDLEPPEDTAQIDVPAAPPRHHSSKAPSRGQLDTPSAAIDASVVDAAHTAEVRAIRAPSMADEIDAWPTQALTGLGSEDMTDNTANVTALIAALPPMRPREPSKHPMDPELLATQAVRVVVWRTPDGVRVAPAGTVVSAIACDAVLVALDPTADLSAWLTNKR